ncbi:hypothetical protein Dimus_001460 [Dionaea muscipula]
MENFPSSWLGGGPLGQLNDDSAAPPQHSWRRRLNSHANILKEFSVTFMEAAKMVRLGIRLWSYVREEASYGRFHVMLWILLRLLRSVTIFLSSR